MNLSSPTSQTKINVAVGSTRRPKIEAAQEAFALISSRMPGNVAFELVSVEAPSGVRHTPLSREETMAGARNRAEALLSIARQRKEQWKFFVGLEGGLDVVTTGNDRMVFLQNWAYVTDGDLGFYGQSGGILLPDTLVTQVVDQGAELAHAMDAYAGTRGIRDGLGAWGALTGGLITRQDAFRVAILNAFAPFFNSSVYGLSSHAALKF